MNKMRRAAAPAWAPTPPPQPPSWFEIVWPAWKLAVEGIILSDRLEGLYMHAVGDGRERRTRPCIGRENGCQLCGPWTSRRWQGYVAIHCKKDGRTYLAQISKEAARCCPELRDGKTELRGMHLRLDRLGEERNSRVKATITPAPTHPLLPEAPDLRVALGVVFGFEPLTVHFAEVAEEVPHGR